MDNWITPAERLPEKDVEVLVTYAVKDGGLRTGVSRYWQDSFGTDHWLNIMTRNVKAWMPMPEPFDGLPETPAEIFDRAAKCLDRMETGDDTVYLAAYARMDDADAGRIVMAGERTGIMTILAETARNLTGEDHKTPAAVLRFLADFMEAFDHE